MEIPNKKIELLISRRDDLPFKNLPFDIFEKILGNVLFTHLDFYEDENLLPEKRYEIFYEKRIKTLSIKNDFARLCRENRLFELSLLIDIDKKNEVMLERRIESLACFACRNGYFDVVMLLMRSKRKIDRFAIIQVAMKREWEFLKFILEEQGSRNFTENILSLIICYDAELELVKYFREKITGLYTGDAIGVAAEKGKLDIVIYLHETMEEGQRCPLGGLEEVLRKGHLNVANFLCNNRPEFMGPRKVKLTEIN